MNLDAGTPGQQERQAESGDESANVHGFSFRDGVFTPNLENLPFCPSEEEMELEFPQFFVPAPWQPVMETRDDAALMTCETTVELEEGVRMVDDMIDLDPSAVRIGLPVEVYFDPVSDEITLPKFRVLEPTDKGKG